MCTSTERPSRTATLRVWMCSKLSPSHSFSNRSLPPVKNMCVRATKLTHMMLPNKSTRHTMQLQLLEILQCNS